MIPENQTLDFLPYLLNEDIYLINENINLQIAVEEIEIPKTEIKPDKTVIESQTIKEDTIKEEIIKKEAPILDQKKVDEKLPTEKAVDPVPEIIKFPPVDYIVERKVIILVGYKDLKNVPPVIADALNKIFEALKINIKEVQIINVLSPESAKIEDFKYQYLILMGGNGKNLDLLKDYTETREKYSIGIHKGIHLFFAEAMDTYMKPENIELKKKFWVKLKLVEINHRSK